MPMIDVYATEGTFADPGSLAQRLAETLMRIEEVPALPMFRHNTAGFVHALPSGAIANVEAEDDYVRVQVLTNLGALDRAKQLAVVEQFTEIVADAAGRPDLKERTWVLLTEGPRRRLGTLGTRPYQCRARRGGARGGREAGRRRRRMTPPYSKTHFIVLPGRCGEYGDLDEARAREL